MRANFLYFGFRPSDFLRPLAALSRRRSGSDFGLRISNSPRRLNEFNLIPLGRVNKGDPMPIGSDMGTVRIFEAPLGELPAEFLETVHREGQMRQVWLDLNRTAGGKITKLDQFFASWWRNTFVGSHPRPEPFTVAATTDTVARRTVNRDARPCAAHSPTR